MIANADPVDASDFVLEHVSPIKASTVKLAVNTVRLVGIAWNLAWDG
jgi:hypothetical protein